MLIKTNLNKLSDLSAKLKRLENDISDYGYKASKIAKNTAQSTKYQYYSEYRVRRACNSVMSAIDALERNIRNVENELISQSRVIGNAVTGYKNADSIEKIDRSPISYVGQHLAGVFGNRSHSNYQNNFNAKYYMGFLAPTKNVEKDDD